jgi:hypothetical protein
MMTTTHTEQEPQGLGLVDVAAVLRDLDAMTPEERAAQLADLFDE